MENQTENKNIAVSVVIPTYRREEQLRRALNSLHEQIYRDFEIILVDDNDDLEWNKKVEQLVKEFSASSNISCVYIQNHPNLGSAEARNVGIKMAKGKYVTFLDDDDIYSPNKLATQYAMMEQHDYDYTITDLALYYDDGKLSEYRRRDYIVKTDVQSLLKYHYMYHITGTDTLMFKKDYLEKIGGFAPINVGDEFYLMERAIMGQGKLGYLDHCEVKAFVHKGEGGLSSGETKLNGENQLYQYKKKRFKQFDKATVRYIKMRHHAVLAFAYLRKKEYFKFFAQGMLSFMSAPVACVNFLINKKR